MQGVDGIALGFSRRARGQRRVNPAYKQDGLRQRMLASARSAAKRGVSPSPDQKRGSPWLTPFLIWAELTRWVHWHDDMEKFFGSHADWAQCTRSRRLCRL